MLNNDGTVAFVAGTNGRDGGVFGIYKGNGGLLTTIADLSGPFSSLGDFDFLQPSINASGIVAFGAALDAGGGGVFNLFTLIPRTQPPAAPINPIGEHRQRFRRKL